MREIKFRAWDKDNNKMLVQSTFMSFHVFLLTPDGLVYENGKLMDYVLMQYTGLKDKNDKEIYEGDIVTESFKGEIIWDGSAKIIQPPIGEVYWANSPSFNIHLLQKGTYQDIETKEIRDNLHMNHYDGIYIDDWEQLEIIGNIYENPELLEKK